MKKIVPIVTVQCACVLLAILCSGCITVNLPPQQSLTQVASPTQPLMTIETSLPQSPPPVLTDEVLLNFEYFSPLLQVPIKLTDGAYSGVVNGGDLHSQLLPGIQYGELNGDGIDDAALLLAENTGGSGNFVSLIVVFSRDDRFQQAAGVLIDDRPVIEAMVIADGVVKLKGLVHAPNDPMVNPTTTINAEYSLFGERIVQTWLTSAFDGGAEHAIYIDSPVDGEEVSGMIQVRGSMPIGPFENNLSLLITDPLGGQLVHEGFIVQAADMGAPAIFDHSLQVPDVTTGTQILLILSEVSMADGSPLAVDSVVLAVR